MIGDLARPNQLAFLFRAQEPVGSTVSTAVLLVILPDLAVILAVALLLTVFAAASPESSIVATVVFEELQLTESVRSIVLPFWSIPTAVYCCVCPDEMDLVTGVIEIEVRLAIVILTEVEPEIPSRVALMVAEP
jgi:hypothetical protein